jgi:indolepyruvate ferredoxin oxidoreductase, beta subunit
MEIPPSHPASTPSVMNVIVAGLGGQGVLKASDILADAAFRAGFDVKKSEVHGMSQRGGSVTSDVRFGPQVFSPLVPPGEADYLLVLAADQVENNRPSLRPAGTLLDPSRLDLSRLANRKSHNVAMLGLLSRHLAMIPESCWLDALQAHLPAASMDANRAAFELGRSQGPEPPRP